MVDYYFEEEKQKEIVVAATLKDVARKAGVSVKTVSNVVNGYIHVTEEMRERVQAALEELDYQPNFSARYLRTKRVGVVALAIPDLSNAYFSDIGNEIITAAASHSYTVLIDHTNGERYNERLVVQGLRPHLIDGIILNPLSLEPEDLQERKMEIPLVLLGERFLNVPYDHVAIDNIAAARLATRHLIELGKRRIAVVGVFMEENYNATETGRLRLQGYKEALAEAGMALDADLIVVTPTIKFQAMRDLFYKREGGAEAIRRLLLLEQPPDAVFCFNDLMALGAIRAIHEAGLRMPEDIAVVGFDNIEEGSYATPSLTTIAPDKRRLAEQAISFLLGRINGTRTEPPTRVNVPFQLIVRESTIGRSA